MPSQSRPPLHSELIYQTALELIQSQGLEKLSMRVLASKLGVDPMAIYHHIPNKAALLNGLYNNILEELFLLPIPDDAPWQTQLKNLVDNFRALALRYPSMFPSLLSSSTVLYNKQKALNLLLGVVRKTGLPDQAVVQASDAVFALVTGFILLELGGIEAAKVHTGTEFLSTQSNPDFGHIEDLAQVLQSNQFKASFDFGFDAIVQGLEAMLKSAQ